MMSGFRRMLAACAALLAMSCYQSRTLHEAVLFCNTPTDTIPYRIPAIAQLPDGRLLALSDYRHCGLDIGFGRVDIYGRIAEDFEWGEPFVLVEGSGIPGSLDCGYGDAAIVADRETGEVLVVTVCGSTVYTHPTTTRDNPNRVYLRRSNDGGVSWNLGKEVTEDIYSLFDESVYGPVQSLFVTSGKIFQSRRVKVGSHYRIYAALCARPNGNRVIYSDDFGNTWNALGGKDALSVPQGDEAKCEELPDGSVVISSRVWGGRFFNVFSYKDVAAGEGSWDEPVFSGEGNDGCTAVANACNGEILIVQAVRKEDGEDVSLCLQSVPSGPERRSVGIYYKEVSESETSESLASDWSGPYQVTDKPSAYSTMILLDNGNVAFYYEESDDPWPRGYDMIFKELSLENITDGKYEVKRRLWKD